MCGWKPPATTPSGTRTTPGRPTPSGTSGGRCWLSRARYVQGQAQHFAAGTRQEGGREKHKHVFVLTFCCTLVPPSFVVAPFGPVPHGAEQGAFGDAMRWAGLGLLIGRSAARGLPACRDAGMAVCRWCGQSPNKFLTTPLSPPSSLRPCPSVLVASPAPCCGIDPANAAARASSAGDL
jgi:hypothetical protein